MSVVVFGSLNLDLVARVERLPLPGETVAGTSLERVPGGKGANQAVGAARLGARARMVGRVGADDFGDALLASLRAEGVDAAGVAREAATPSGVALIELDAAGENRIIVVPGANGLVGEADLERLGAALDGARVLLLQLEVPLAAVAGAARLARDRGVTVVLDPAPAPAGGPPDELLRLADVLTPNQGEAAALVGFALDEDAAVERAARALRERGPAAVVVKLGARGAYRASADGAGFLAPVPVRAVDTVAAGDAFNAGLAVALAEGRALEDALEWALAAGALAVTRPGAQAAMPRRAELEALLARR